MQSVLGGKSMCDLCYSDFHFLFCLLLLVLVRFSGLCTDELIVHLLNNHHSLCHLF